jgi:hypothetical protein
MTGYLFFVLPSDGLNRLACQIISQRESLLHLMSNRSKEKCSDILSSLYAPAVGTPLAWRCEPPKCESISEDLGLPRFVTNNEP